jgi:crotonobetainyl-CoA:carnitine CoA-transferase CaiB-like acyl-CoA transferase
VDGPFSVPVAAFTFAHGGPQADRPPPRFGEHNDEVLGELGYTAGEIAGFRATKII